MARRPPTVLWNGALRPGVTRARGGWLLAWVWLLPAWLTAATPPPNLAATAAGARIEGPRNSSGCLSPEPAALDGQVDDYDAHRGYMWADLGTPLIVRLAAPARVSAVELLLLDVDARDYGYVVETSLNGAAWDLAGDRSGSAVRGWQRHRFAPRQAALLRVRFTRTSLPTRSYHVVELAAYDLPEATTTTPLHQAWQAGQAGRAAAGRSRLGVAPAEALLGDEALHAEVQALAPGMVLRRDLDQDGDPDALLYRDGKALVVALDDDDDLTWTDTAPDGRDDCLAVDLDGDGHLDRAIDYSDTDRNGLVDRMVQTYTGGSPWGRQALVLIADLDQRGPRRLWSLTPTYGYDQGSCQWTCDFNGDGFFALFGPGAANDAWVGAWENPFCFYDPDGDGLAEETVRLSGRGRTLRSARYGINADNDVPTAGQDYDYDFSVTALGRLEADPADLTRETRRDGSQTGEFLRWDRVRDVVREHPWPRALLVWDENDRNVAPGDTHERWEGVINAAYRGFPQEGGPHCGTLNKRYELDADGSGRMRLYYWPADGRLHLLGAEQGTLTADADGDGRADLTIEYRDRDGDGCFDHREITTRVPARTRVAAPAAAPTETLALSFAAVHALWPDRLRETLAAQTELLAALTAAGDPSATPLAALLEGLRQAPGAAASTEAASLEARRFRADLEIELRFAALLAPASGNGASRTTPLERIRQAQELADRGALGAAAAVLRGQPAPPSALPPPALPPPATPAAAPRARAVGALLGAKITAGWESELIGYRAYWGKVDVFGKTDGQLRLGDFNRPEIDYHRDLGWGMDILNNGLTSGLGGLNLWAEGQRLQVQWRRDADPAVPLRYRLVDPGPATAAVEMLIRDWETPCGRLDLTQRFTIAPGQRHTDAEITWHSQDRRELEFGPGLVTFPGAEVRSSPERGYVWVWGDQGIGAGPVGLALVFDPSLCRRIEPSAGEVFVHLAATGPEIRTTLRLSAAWARDGNLVTAAAWHDYVEALAADRPETGRD